jgi:hypothetical protein
MWARGSLLRQIFELKSIGAVTFFVITGLIFLVISLQLSQSQQAGWVVILYCILIKISTIFIVSGLWTGISEWFLKNSFIDIFQSQTRYFSEEIIKKVDNDYEEIIKKIDKDYNLLNQKMEDDYTTVALLIYEKKDYLMS